MRASIHEKHYGWDNSLPPVAEVDSGAELTLELGDASGGQLSRSSSSEDVQHLDFAKVNPVTGPIHVVGAEPGDCLKISILGIETGRYGWTAIIPGFGLLADVFSRPDLAWSTVTEREVVLPFGMAVPAIPMVGTIGVALREPGWASIVPPRTAGGNLDIRHLTAGAEVILPVEVPGALLSLGDAHAAMGDGEICGTGVETSATVRIRVDLVKHRAMDSPMYRTSARSVRAGETVATTGIGPDLMEAARGAASRMVEEIVTRTGLRAEDAYMLCSITSDLEISEIVNKPNYVVSCRTPLEVLGV